MALTRPKIINPNNPVYISYAWNEPGSEHNEDGVNKLCELLTENGIAYARDSHGLCNKGENIKNTEEEIGKGDAVIVVLSEKYLRSPHCMYEWALILKSGNIEKRVFLIMMGDVNFKEKFTDYQKRLEQEVTKLKEDINNNRPITETGYGFMMEKQYVDLVSSVYLYTRNFNKGKNLVEVDNFDFYEVIDPLKKYVQELVNIKNMPSKIKKLEEKIKKLKKENLKLNNELKAKKSPIGCDTDFIVKGVQFKMVFIHIECRTIIGNQHFPKQEITVEDYYIGETAVTQELWKALGMKMKKQLKEGSDYPIGNISWNDANAFIEKLNDNDDIKNVLPCGYRFCLPNEIEWVYAASDGYKNLYSGTNNLNELKKYAHFGVNKTTIPVNEKSPNNFHLYNMTGNVYEWCETSFGKEKVLHGGDCNSGEKYCRNTHYEKVKAEKCDESYGLRLVLRKFDNKIHEIIQ